MALKDKMKTWGVAAAMVLGTHGAAEAQTTQSDDNGGKKKTEVKIPDDVLRSTIDFTFDEKQFEEELRAQQERADSIARVREKLARQKQDSINAVKRAEQAVYDLNQRAYEFRNLKTQKFVAEDENGNRHMLSITTGQMGASRYLLAMTYKDPTKPRGQQVSTYTFDDALNRESSYWYSQTSTTTEKSGLFGLKKKEVTHYNSPENQMRTLAWLYSTDWRLDPKRSDFNKQVIKAGKWTQEAAKRAHAKEYKEVRMCFVENGMQIWQLYGQKTGDIRGHQEIDRYNNIIEKAKEGKTETAQNSETSKGNTKTKKAPTFAKVNTGQESR